MADLLNVVEEYKSSTFYQKYKDTYFSDKILREVLKCEVLLHPLYGLKEMSYEDVHKLSTDVMRDLVNEFAAKVNFKDEEMFWKILYAIYFDPDPNGVREFGGVTCTADGLLSIRRIYHKYGISNSMVDEYEMYRKVPVFFFPQENNGINQKRASAFGDKMDHTLFDLKNYFDAKTDEERNQCKLISAYNQPKTKIWLDAIRSFEKLVDWFGIKGIFVNDSYEVYDIEKGQDQVITDYLDEYSWEWSSDYYNNLKLYIEQFMSK